MDLSMHSRIAQTVTLVYSAALEGWCTGIYGPTLPELLCVYHTDLKTLSSILFVFGLMNTVGSMFACFLLTKINLYLAVAIATTVASAFMSLMSLIPSIYGAIVMAAVIAWCVGISFNCRVYGMKELWPGKPFALHLSIAGFAVGPIIASAIAKPFLGNDSRNHTNPNLTCSHPYTHVQYAFIILACLGLPVMCSSFGFYLYYRNNDSNYIIALPHRSDVITRRHGYNLFLILFFLLCIPAGGIFVTYGNLLTTYGYGGDLHLGVSYMASVTALFWATFVFGRLFMTLLSGFFQQIRIIIFCYIGLFLAVFILLFFGKQSAHLLAWSTAIFGLFCAPFSAFSFSWAAQHVEITGFVVALGSVGEYTGAMIGPYIGGLLMGYFGAKAFLYVVLGIVSVQFVIFIAFYLVGRFHLDKDMNEHTLLIERESEFES